MRFLGASILVVIFIPLLAGEYGVAGLTLASIFLAWMSGLALAGVKFLKSNRLATTIAQIGLFLFSLGIGSLTDWTFFVVSEVEIKLLYLAMFTFCLTWIIAPRATLAAEASEQNE
jgi:hypothetical protein